MATGGKLLRVMTWNIRSGFGSRDLPVRPRETSQLRTIVEVIRQSEVDVVGLQEVDRDMQRSGGYHQAALLGEALGMEHRHAPNWWPDGVGDGLPRYGTALLSRLRIVHARNIPIPTPSGWEPRGVLDAVVEAPDGRRLRVLNTHFQADSRSRDASDQRAAGVELAIGLVRESLGPTVLTGDLNAGPGNAALARLFEDMSPLVDAWSAIHPDESGHTLPASPLVEPRSRIDYIFTTRDVWVRDVDVVRIEQTQLASDHYPVVAAIEW